MMKPLYLFLKGEFYDQFVAGTKPGNEEFRPYGPRWNERVCALGRPVIISRGYGKANRHLGVITGFRVSSDPTLTEAWAACGYSTRFPGVPAACIQLGSLVPLEAS